MTGFAESCIPTSAIHIAEMSRSPVLQAGASVYTTCLPEGESFSSWGSTMLAKASMSSDSRWPADIVTLRLEVEKLIS